MKIEEAEPFDSLEAVPEMDRVWQAGTPENADYELLQRPPASAREARARGVKWYMKDRRKYRVSQVDDPPSSFQNSATLATNRNRRRKAMGYRDVYSTRERNWPTPSRAGTYKRQDREAQAWVDRLLQADI